MFYTVFKDAELNARINTEGFVVVNNFLDAEAINKLRSIYYETGVDADRNAFTTFAASDNAYRKHIDELTKEVFGPLFKQHLSGFLPYWGNFFCKKPGGMQMPLHADWQYVEEPGNISINIWCPLTETNDVNGAMGVVPGSHNVINQFRGMNLYQFYLKNGEEIKQKYGHTLHLNPGSALIYDHRLLHYSLPNTSVADRLAITMVGVPENAPVFHFASDAENGRVIKYRLLSSQDLFKLKFKSLPEGITPEKDFGFVQFEELTPEAVKRALETATQA